MRDMLTSDLRRALAAGEVDELMRSWADPVRAEALRVYRSMNLRRRDHLDEIESMAWEVVAGLIDDERAGRTRTTYSFGAFFSMRLRNHVKQWLDSEVGLAPASGMSLARRRGRRIRGGHGGPRPRRAHRLPDAERRGDVHGYFLTGRPGHVAGLGRVHR